MSEANKHIEILGKSVTDKVTNFSGIATSVSFDLYGCIQVVVTPLVDEKGKCGESRWFDIRRLAVKGKKSVMKAPDFDKGYISEGKKGAAPKPA